MAHFSSKTGKQLKGPVKNRRDGQAKKTVIYIKIRKKWRKEKFVEVIHFKNEPPLNFLQKIFLETVI